MKSQFFSAAALAALVGAVLLAFQPSTNGQAGGGVDDPALAAVLTEVAAQQAGIADNQTKIDESIAAIAEDVRQARLFVARGGGASKGK